MLKLFFLEAPSMDESNDSEESILINEGQFFRRRKSAAFHLEDVIDDINDKNVEDNLSVDLHGAVDDQIKDSLIIDENCVDGDINHHQNTQQLLSENRVKILHSTQRKFSFCMDEGHNSYIYI